jgi:hypothetical protein
MIGMSDWVSFDWLLFNWLLHGSTGRVQLQVEALHDPPSL